MGISRKFTVVALLCFLFSVQAARATTVRYVPFEEQVDSASVIVVAVTESARTFRQGGLINTDYSFRVLENVKGNPVTVVTVRTLGGELDGVGMSVDGAPRFKIGDRYVLFLEAIGGSVVYRVVGFSQGSYAVAKAANGKQKVAPQLAGAEQVHVIGGQSTAAAGGQGLDEFLSRVRSRLAGSNARSLEKQK